MRRRVVVTGAGVVAASAIGVEQFWDALEQGVSGVGLHSIDGVGPIPIVVAPDLPADRWFSRRDARRMDRCAQLAVAAGTLALEDAGDLDLESHRFGTSIGSAHGGALTLESAFETRVERGADRVSPFTVPLSLTNHAASATARVLRLHGPSVRILHRLRGRGRRDRPGVPGDTRRPRRRHGRRRCRGAARADDDRRLRLARARWPRRREAPKGRRARSTASATAS